jgi:hypothetical protein
MKLKQSSVRAYGLVGPRRMVHSSYGCPLECNHMRISRMRDGPECGQLIHIVLDDILNKSKPSNTTRFILDVTHEATERVELCSTPSRWAVIDLSTGVGR